MHALTALGRWRKIITSIVHSMGLVNLMRLVYLRLMGQVGRGESIAMKKILICVYTCEADRHMLEEFNLSPIGIFLRKMPGANLVYVYADPDIPSSFHRGQELFLRSPERYDALSLKTAEMIKYAVHNFEFHRLVKIDVTCVRTDFSARGYEGRVALDIEKLVCFLSCADPVEDYDGFILHAGANRENAEAWAAKKGGIIDYSRLFGDGPMPPFFSGKCYVLSRKFAEFVAEFGSSVAHEHSVYMLGSEDTMVGRLYQMFQNAVWPLATSEPIVDVPTAGPCDGEL